MTPERLDAIRLRALMTDWEHDQTEQDRADLLDHADHLLSRAKEYRELWCLVIRDYRKLVDRITGERKAAMHLLAHQQARGIEAREEEAQGITDYLDLRDHADAQSVRAQSAEAERDTLRAELARKDAEIERLHRANVGLVAQASSREHDRKQLREALAGVARCGLGLDLFDVDLADRIRAALGEEVTP